VSDGGEVEDKTDPLDPTDDLVPTGHYFGDGGCSTPGRPLPGALASLLLALAGLTLRVRR
jgi:hypothetical protein